MIAADNHLALMAVMFGIVGLTLWAERYSWVQKLSVPLLVIVIPLILSNIGLLPRTAPAYSFVSNYFVMVAIPLLLFKADLKRIVSETGRLLLAFGVAVGGTLAGAAVAFYLIPLGEWGAQSAAAMTGGYIGGGMNFVAVAKAVQLDDPSRFATTLGAEASAGLTYLMFLAIIPAMGWFKRWDAKTHPAAAPASSTTGLPVDLQAGTEQPLADTDAAAPTASPPSTETGPGITDLALGLGLSLAICAAGNWLAALAGYPQYGILVITLLAVAAANIAPRQMARLKGDAAVGMLLMYVFFTAFGAGTDLISMLRDAPLLLLFAVTVIVVHFGVSFGVGRLLGFSAREVAIASNACLLGPPTAAALAAKQGWDDLVTPGILCGVFGYVIGNFVGVSMYAVLS